MTLVKVLTNMVRYALYVRPDQLRQLNVLSEKSGAPVAELIRRAIDAYIKKN